MPDPLSGTLANRLEAIERRLSELSRRGVRASPLLAVSLTTNVATWDRESKDVIPVTSWRPTPEADNRGMWRYNTTDGTFAELPCPGRYRITVATHWEMPGIYNPSVPNCLATSVLLNGTSAPANGIAQTTAYQLPYSGTSYQTTSEDRVLNTGDRLRINFWSRYANAVLLAQTLTAKTHLVVRYLGPS